MERKDIVKYGLHSMELEGFQFTAEEKVMWDKIAAGELPLSADKEDATEFDRLMRECFPEKYDENTYS